MEGQFRWKDDRRQRKPDLMEWVTDEEADELQINILVANPKYCDRDYKDFEQISFRHPTISKAFSYGQIHCTRSQTKDETKNDYRLN